MNLNEKTIIENQENPKQGLSRRNFITAGGIFGTAMLLSPLVRAESKVEKLAATIGGTRYSGSTGIDVKAYDIATNGINLHVTELGQGPAVLFCHGFPDTSYTWRRQMQAIAAAGYRAIAPDMRGCGKSSAPADYNLYTPLQTCGDLVGLLDALNIPTAVIVGHDWGATHAWNAALMRPDRFTAVMCLSVPYNPRGDASVFDKMRKAGKEDKFYMFEQMKPEADQIWANAKVTIPGILYWASGSAPAATAWNPMDPNRNFHRAAPEVPSWVEPDYLAYNIAEYQRTGFHGALNYYRAAEPFFELSAPWKGAKITQPSFYMTGKMDGLKGLYPPLSVEGLRVALPGLTGIAEVDGAGHWVQHEASAKVSEQLIQFLKAVKPS